MIRTWLKSLLGALGFEAVRRSEDPVLRELLAAYRELRLAPGDALRWEDRLPQPASMSHLRNLLAGQAIDLVLDVGANVGQFAGLVRRLGYAGDILSFEPGSAARARLRSAAAGDARWQVRAEAIGRVRGSTRLDIRADSSFSSTLSNNEAGRRRFGSLVDVVASETVEVVPLDSLLGEFSGRDRRILLKTDTQGNDLDVLAGAGETLGSCRAVLSEAAAIPIYEGAPRLEELTRAMERAGFSLSGLFPTGHQPWPGLALIELDCYFVRDLG
jgi:FkbM family methyltransferase